MIRDVSTSLDMTKEKSLIGMFSLSPGSQLLTSLDVEFAGGENGNVFYHDATFRDPKIWDATFSQYSAQFIHLDGIGC